MKREWKPGDVALVIGDSIPTERIGIKDTHGWAVSNEKGDATHARWVNESYVTPLRPLVVIDPEDREQVERLRASLERMSFSPWACGAATCLTTALREFANPTPPKPDEPTGLGAVVEDAKGYRFVRGYDDESTHPWHIIDPAANHPFAWWKWSDIAAVRVLSEGVQP